MSSQRQLRLLGGLLVPDQLGEHVSCVGASRSGQPAQLRQVRTLTGQLNQDINGIRVAGISEPAQLNKIAAFTRELDQLILRIAVTARRSLAQHRKLVRHAAYLPLVRPRT